MIFKAWAEIKRVVLVGDYLLLEEVVTKKSLAMRWFTNDCSPALRVNMVRMKNSNPSPDPPPKINAFRAVEIT